MVVKLGLSY